MALMSTATVAVSPGKDDEMEGISKKENKRRQSRREREAEAKKEDRDRQGKKGQSSHLTGEENLHENFIQLGHRNETFVTSMVPITSATVG